MKNLLIIACLFLAGCAIPKVIYVDRGYPVPSSGFHGNIVEPLEQSGSGMSFMCRNAINRRDSGGASIFCR